MTGWQCPVCGLVNSPYMPHCAGSHYALPFTVSTGTNATGGAA